MKPLKVGDKVKAYSESWCGAFGEVTDLKVGSPYYEVVLKSDGYAHFFHRKQLRRLKPPKPKKPEAPEEVWVNVYYNGDCFPYISKQDADHYGLINSRIACIKYRRVREGE